MRIVFAVIALVLILVPTWSGDPRLPLYEGTPDVRVARVALDAEHPKRTRVGPLTYLGGLHFSSRDPAFGGFSALAVRGDRFLLLSDGGLRFGFTMGSDLRPGHFAFGTLPAGPGDGWRKEDRDSESLAVDPATGDHWVGFERANAIWRYDADFTRTIRTRVPPEMARWPRNGGAESLVRVPGGRFLILSEDADAPGGGKQALLFDRDPTDPRARAMRFAFVPPGEYVPTDAAILPDGRLLVLTRNLTLREGFTAKLLLVDPRAIRPGARVAGRELATFAYPLLHDNFEGLAVTREGDATILWMLSDDNAPSWFQRSLLLKFRIDLSPDAAHDKSRPG
ncbi:MAG: esterase-like activity of phytase family protein [Pseudomonadota bacterium]